jgi:hypothetical protein
MDTQPPFAGLQRALDEGRLTLRDEEAPRPRRYIPDIPLRSTTDREGRIRFGSASRIPELRRDHDLGAAGHLCDQSDIIGHGRPR